MVKLGKVTVIYTGTGFPKELQGCKEGKYPFYKVGDISKNVLAGYKKLTFCDNYLGENDAKKIKGTILPEDTVVFAKIGEAVKLNRRAITTRECLVDNNVMGIAPVKSLMDIQYLYYYMSSIKLETLAEATTVPSVKKGIIENLEINLPDMDTQKNISNILSRVDDLIISIKKQLADLEVVVKSRFIEMFGDQTNPLEWPIVEVQEVADIRVGVVIKPAQYYTEEEHGIKAFRSLNIGPMIIKSNNWVYFSEEGNKKNAKSQLQENDLLIVRSGSPGTACVVTKDYEGCNAVDIIIARPLLSAVNPYYLCAYTNFPHGKRQIEDGTGGAAQQHFNIGKYNKLKLMLPPIELQNKFEGFYSQVDKSKLAIQQSLDELETLKKSLMQQYFG